MTVHQDDYGVYTSTLDHRCMVCGACNDATTEVGGVRGKPRDGDVSVCLECGGLSIFTGVGLMLRAATAGERAEIEADENVLMAQRITRLAREIRAQTAPGQP